MDVSGRPARMQLLLLYKELDGLYGRAGHVVSCYFELGKSCGVTMHGLILMIFMCKYVWHQWFV